MQIVHSAGEAYLNTNSKKTVIAPYKWYLLDKLNKNDLIPKGLDIYMNYIPAVSVIMTAYNSSAFISESIQSVLAQNFTDFELIIIDDGSTDDTWNLICAFNDNRIVKIHKENSGAAAGRKFCHQSCKGESYSYFRF